MGPMMDVNVECKNICYHLRWKFRTLILQYYFMKITAKRLSHITHKHTITIVVLTGDEEMVYKLGDILQPNIVTIRAK